MQHLMDRKGERCAPFMVSFLRPGPFKNESLERRWRVPLKALFRISTFLSRLDVEAVELINFEINKSILKKVDFTEWLRIDDLSIRRGFVTPHFHPSTHSG